jgi:hypothetical protein
MGIMQNPLGINLTNHMPLTHSVFNNDFDQGEPFIPPTSYFMITEDGKFMIDEITLDFMITE